LYFNPNNERDGQCNCNRIVLSIAIFNGIGYDDGVGNAYWASSLHERLLQFYWFCTMRALQPRHLLRCMYVANMRALPRGPLW